MFGDCAVALAQRDLVLSVHSTWIRRMQMGVKERITVCSKKIHLPFLEVGLKRQRPLLMVEMALTRDTEVWVVPRENAGRKQIVANET